MVFKLKDTTNWGEKTQKKFTSLDSAIDYCELMKYQIT